MADPMRLACWHCGWRPGDGLTMGVAAQHFETEHGTDEVKFELVVVCDRCDRVMTLFATLDQGDPCHRGRVVKQRKET